MLLCYTKQPWCLQVLFSFQSWSLRLVIKVGDPEIIPQKDGAFNARSTECVAPIYTKINIPRLVPTLNFQVCMLVLLRESCTVSQLNAKEITCCQKNFSGNTSHSQSIPLRTKIIYQIYLFHVVMILQRNKWHQLAKWHQ